MNNLEQEIKQHLEERGWNKLRPGDLAKSICIEAAELLELFQWGNPDLDEVERNTQLVKDIRKELADVVIYALDLSVTMGFDLEELVREKLEHVKKKYPTKIFNPGSSDEPGREEEYWKIKHEHRKKDSEERIEK